MAAYLERFEGKVAVNVGLLVGNSALRISRLGWQDVPADEAALADMRAHAARVRWQPGALGLSSGLDYPPGAFATTDELAALTNEAAKAGGFYHTHVRYPLGDRYLDPFRKRSRSAGAAAGRSTSPTSTTARRTRAVRSRCSR